MRHACRVELVADGLVEPWESAPSNDDDRRLFSHGSGYVTLCSRKSSYTAKDVQHSMKYSVCGGILVASAHFGHIYKKRSWNATGETPRRAHLVQGIWQQVFLDSIHKAACG